VNPAWLNADWPAPAGVRVISTFRGGGLSAQPFESLNLGDHVGDDLKAVADNRRALTHAAGLPAQPCWLKQVHGVAVANLDVPGSHREADAAVARGAGVVCAILTADCLPIMLAAESGDAVAAAHAGWRGLSAGVIEATVLAMGSSPQHLMAWLGPAIGPLHFEVGSEVRETFLKQDREAGEAFQRNARGRYMADLALLARRRLAKLGINRIYGAGECTYAHADRYFSHRRDGVTGRQATLIWRER
jgi:polyphenol oxidase